MAGVGVKLQKMYSKNSIISKMFGFIYSTILSIAPMVLIMLSLLVMGQLLGFSKVGYAQRELFSCTTLYIFIFSLLASAPFTSVLSRCMSDIIYDEAFDDIMPCFLVGLLLNTIFGCLFAIPFCVAEFIIGGVSFIYVFTGFFGFVALLFVFYAQLYLNIFKDYKKTAIFFTIGTLFTVLLSLFLGKVLHWSITYSMLLSLSMGFLLIGCLEFGTICRYFKENSGHYKKILGYFKKYWKLVITNSLYLGGLFVHNFVFWTTDLSMRVEKVFVCAPSYDMATCIAMFTNISATIIFISRVEMYFHKRYRAYSEAVIGGRGVDIDNTKRRMFSQLAAELMNLARVQFILSVVIFFICVVILPRFGFSGMVMRIYPSMAAGYFILFIMYACIVFLYYFNDLNGAVLTSVSFFAATLLASIGASRMTELWYGLGALIGSLVGWAVAYARIRWVERNMDVHVFCDGNILQKAKGDMPSGKVYDRYAIAAKNQKG